MRTDGIPNENHMTVTIPKPPVRTGSLGDHAQRVYDVLLSVLGIVGVSVSGWSIATLLHDAGGMPWVFACLGVGVYDLLAFMAGLMVYIRRAEPHRAVGAQLLMVLAIGGSSYVNAMHGRAVGGPLVALVFGAAPVVFEVAFAMRHDVMSAVTAVLFPRAMWRRYKLGVWVKLHTGSLPEPERNLGAEVPEAGGIERNLGAEVPEAGGTSGRKFRNRAEPRSGSSGTERNPSGTSERKFRKQAEPGRKWFRKSRSRVPEVPEAGGTRTEVVPEPTEVQVKGVPTPPAAPDSLPEVPQVPTGSGSSAEPERNHFRNLGVEVPAGSGTRAEPLPEPRGGSSGTWVEVPEPERNFGAEVPEPVPVGTDARAEAVARELREALPGARITGASVGARFAVSDSMGRKYIRLAHAINEARGTGGA